MLLGELGEQVAQRVRADRPEPAWREFEATLLALDQPRLFEHLGELAEPFELPRSIVTEQVADAIHVGLGERSRVRRVLQEVLELIEIAEFLHRLHRLAPADRVLALEVVRLAPVHLREHLLQVRAELVELPAEVHVAEQLVAQLLELRPLLG